MYSRLKNHTNTSNNTNNTTSKFQQRQQSPPVGFRDSVKKPTITTTIVNQNREQNQRMTTITPITRTTNTFNTNTNNSTNYRSLNRPAAESSRIEHATKVIITRLNIVNVDTNDMMMLDVNEADESAPTNALRLNNNNYSSSSTSSSSTTSSSPTDTIITLNPILLTSNNNKNSTTTTNSLSNSSVVSESSESVSVSKPTTPNSIDWNSRNNYNVCSEYFLNNSELIRT